MQKSLLTHIIVAALFFALVSLMKNWLSLIYIPLWIGGAIGAVLPDVDHLIYVYLLRPHELTSQRAIRMFNKGDIKNTLGLLQSTTDERRKLIFHRALFQVVFIMFAYLIVSSTSNLLGIGLVLGFLVHIAVDQYVDLIKSNSLSSWFEGTTIVLDKNRSTLYWIASILVLAYLAVVL